MHVKYNESLACKPCSLVFRHFLYVFTLLHNDAHFKLSFGISPDISLQKTNIEQLLMVIRHLTATVIISAMAEHNRWDLLCANVSLMDGHVTTQII